MGISYQDNEGGGANKRPDEVVINPQPATTQNKREMTHTQTNLSLLWVLQMETHSRFGSSVAPVVDGCRYGHHQRGEAVRREVVVLTTRRLAFKHLHHQHIQLHRLHAEPAEHGQQEEVQQTGQNRTHHLHTHFTYEHITAEVVWCSLVYYNVIWCDLV